MEKDLEASLKAPAFWHQRYTQQIKWTESARRYLFAHVGVQTSDSILEIGCGSGAVMQALTSDGYQNLTGIDIDLNSLQFNTVPSELTCADGQTLPFSDNAFDHTLCHFVLMWVDDPAKMVTEMKRVTRPGGWVFALAESDYSRRITSPSALEALASLQTESLEKQGVNVRMGRQLSSHFIECGLTNVLKGTIGNKNTSQGQNALSGDLSVLRNDLAYVLKPGEIETTINQAKRISEQSNTKWYVPVHYTCGRVNK